LETWFALQVTGAYHRAFHRGLGTTPIKPAHGRSEGATKVRGERATATVLLSLRVENNSKFVRGKKRVKDGIERYLRHQYAATLKPSGEYRLKIPYRTDEELDKTMADLLQHIAFEADLRNCFSESNAQLKGSQDRTW
jgi:hypothetical protein